MNTSNTPRLTPQPLARSIGTICITCPVNVVRNWEAEFKRWLPSLGPDGAGGGGVGGVGLVGSGGGGGIPVHVLDDRKKKAVERVQVCDGVVCPSVYLLTRPPIHRQVYPPTHPPTRP